MYYHFHAMMNRMTEFRRFRMNSLFGAVCSPLPFSSSNQWKTWKIYRVATLRKLCHVHNRKRYDYLTKFLCFFQFSFLSFYFGHRRWTVHPLIQVPNMLVGAPLGVDISIVCNAEASPKAINYWQRENGKFIRKTIAKYKLSSMETLCNDKCGFRRKLFKIHFFDKESFYNKMNFDLTLIANWLNKS